MLIEASIPPTEHSTITSWMAENEFESQLLLSRIYLNYTTPHSKSVKDRYCICYILMCSSSV